MRNAAVRRVRQIAGTVVPASCGASIAELEGEAIARSGAVRVVLLKVGERGAPLAPNEEVEQVFRQRGLEPIWVESINGIPVDTTIIVTMGASVGPEVLAKAPKLRLVAAAFTGFDHIDVAACKAKGVVVTNVPGYSTDATAELAIAFILEHLRRLPQCHQAIRHGSWACPPQEDLQSRTVGIVGVGKIGMRLAELFRAFKVKNILGYSVTQDPAFLTVGGTYMDSLAGLFTDADVICVCVPLTELSKGMISGDLMELLRPNCILVNVSRGGVIDETALAQLLREGRFRAALDVFSIEPLPADSPLRTVQPEQLLMTPHVGYQSGQSLERRLDATVKNILAFLAGQTINAVA